MNKATTVPTTPEATKQIEDMLTAIQNLMINLYGRWQDEKEYEDIKDYALPIVQKLPAGFTMAKMNKQPFGFDFGIGTLAVYRVVVTRNSFGWRRPR